MALNPFRCLEIIRKVTCLSQTNHILQRHIGATQRHWSKNDAESEDKKEVALELATQRAKKIFEKEFADHFKDGQFVSRMSYVEFIDEALAKLKELGLDRDLNAYKELLRVFPPGQYWPKKWDGNFGLFHAPQQLAAVRVLHQMEMKGLKPDKDFEKIIVSAFSKKSDVWLKVVRMNFWTMKGRNVDPNPLPDELPKEPHQLAKLAVARMVDDPKAILTVTNTSRVPNSVDKTWIVFSHSPSQKEIISSLPEKSILYIEEGGTAYVGTDYLSYYLLKYYVDDDTLKKKNQPPALDYNYNTLQMKFFGKPVKEKFLEARERYYVDGCYVLGICATGTSSQDSLLSWLKILQERNPNLARLNVVFKMTRPTPEIIQYQEGAHRKAESDADEQSKRYSPSKEQRSTA